MSKLPVILSPQDTANLVADMATLEQEHLRLLLLNFRNQVLSIQTLYVGTAEGLVWSARSCCVSTLWVRHSRSFISTS